MNFLINLLAEETTSSTSQGSPLGGIWIWVILIAVFAGSIFLSSRQRKKQQAELEKKMSNIKVGDVVKTIGLVYGEIVEVDTEMETFVIKTGTEENPSYIKVDKMAIYQVIPPLNNAVEENNESAEVFDNAPVEENSEAVETEEDNKAE